LTKLDPWSFENKSVIKNSCRYKQSQCPLKKSCQFLEVLLINEIAIPIIFIRHFIFNVISGNSLLLLVKFFQIFFQKMGKVK